MSNAVVCSPFRSESLGNSRSKAPVFVVGCPRSGTTLPYHMLFSAGNSTIYRAESQVFNLLSRATRVINLHSAGLDQAAGARRTRSGMPAIPKGNKIFFDFHSLLSSEDFLTSLGRARSVREQKRLYPAVRTY